MNVRLFCFAVLFLLFNDTNILAKGSNISCTVTNEHNEAITTANVVLLNEAGKTLVKSGITDETGRCVLDNVEYGSYQLKVTMLGYLPYSNEHITVDRQDMTLPPIVLKQKDNKLKEVTVRGQKPLIEIHADKLVVNVENSIVNTGSTALEILARSPGVNVDQNDNISIKGKQGVNVMIDGKSMVVSGTDLANMLKSMPSNAISQVEIISNPGAKYDAAGVAGIINIRTKRDRNMGMNGSVNAGYAQGVYPKYNAGINLNYRNKKISGYVSYNYSRRWWFNHLELNRRFYAPNSDAFQFAYVQDNFMKMPVDNHNSTFGLDYSIGKRTIIGIAGTGGINTFTRQSANTSRALDGNEQLIYNFNSNGGQNQEYYNYSGNANLRHRFNDKGESLNIDVDYARYWNHSLQDFVTDYTKADGSSYQPSYFMRSDMNGITQIRALKSDYSLPLNDKTNFDAGIKTTYVTSDNEPLFYEKTTGDYTLDLKRSNHFIYRENINAAYVNYNRKWEKWSTQIGLRTENTNVEAEQLTLDSLYKTSYTQLFPSLAVQRNLNDKHDLGITLSRRIQRPNYQQLNPFKFFIDNTTCREG
ncbi:MAG: outer membrane beta-barrel protein [Chitinophagaceae bacterium]|nr:outer membrane beta-barrel protein [Chitinophagaceae bacterium]